MFSVLFFRPKLHSVNLIIAVNNFYNELNTF